MRKRKRRIQRIQKNILQIKKVEKLSITNWALEDRPREKLERLGADSLSNAELLGVLIGSGNNNESAVDLMKRVLNDCNNNLNTSHGSPYLWLYEYY